MKDPRLARRYAQALFQVAEAHHVAEQVDEEYRRFVALLDENQRLRAFLATPRVAAAEKERVLRSVLGGLVHRVLEEFLLYLRRKGRFALVAESSVEYHEILQEVRRLTTAVVTSAVPLDDGERQKLVAALEARTGKTVTLEEKVDPRVIAGASVVVAGQIIDDTVRHHLDELRDELRHIPVHMATQEVG